MSRPLLRGYLSKPLAPNEILTLNIGASRGICYTSSHLVLWYPVGGGVPPREAVAGGDGRA